MRLSLWQGRIQTEVDVLGDGPPLLYLHGPWGLRSDLKFLDELAQKHTVYAPRFPGTTQADPDAIHQLDSLHDVLVYQTELMDALQLDTAIVLGHSVGAMLACELAAVAPRRVQRLVLIDPIGLWMNDHPVKNWMIMPDDALRECLFADASGAAAEEFFAQTTDPEVRADRIWALACTAKFIWPIPDKGLSRRIHQVQARTLLVWGQQDAVVAPVYADQFAQRLAEARIVPIEHAGHLPHLEQPRQVLDAINTFLLEK